MPFPKPQPQLSCVVWHGFSSFSVSAER
jgi:hypothetical protein